jgi:hypothetical protein
VLVHVRYHRSSVKQPNPRTNIFGGFSDNPLLGVYLVTRPSLAFCDLAPHRESHFF